jgi:hypothetical protein
MTNPNRKFAAGLLAGDTTLEVLLPAQLIQGEVAVAIDGAPATLAETTVNGTDAEGNPIQVPAQVTVGGAGSAGAFTIVGSRIVLSAPLGADAYVEVTFGDHD